jgi:signal transduction histidine kinase
VTGAADTYDDSGAGRAAALPKALRPAEPGGVGKVRLVAVLLSTIVILSLPILEGVSRLRLPAGVPSIPWWGMAVLYYLFELAVVHFRFRRDAHSFSVSEIATVLGLYLADPLSLVIGQVVGGAVALVFNRHQRGVRVVFNVAAFGIQTLVVAGIFYGLVDRTDPLSLSGALGALIGSLVALGLATLLITGAIHITGGRVAASEMAEVVGFGAIGTLMNIGLGMVAVTVIWLRPQSAWLAFLPIALLFVAFRAYTNQRDQRSRIESLYDLTFELHGSPLLEDASRVAAEGIRRLFEANAVHIFLIPEQGQLYALRTSATSDQPTDVMTPVSLPTSGRWSAVLKQSLLLPKLGPNDLPIPGMPSPSHAMTVPLISGDNRAGVIIVADPLSAVSGFNSRDLKMAETIASRLMVSLENGRLEDSLAELTRLKERLEALIRSKDQFLASVSHELRTPLTGIVGLAQELSRGKGEFGEAEVDEFLSLIYEQSSELANIVEDLLVAARADIGTLVIKPVRSDLVREAETVLSTHVRRSGRKSIDPAVRGARDVWALFDPLRFRQVMRNLVTNALRYGGESVWVEVERRGDRVALTVVDDGMGVPASSVDEIFEPYTRASNSIMNPQSVGLGLSVSRQLARLMGGDLVYEPGDGCARFVLLLPVAD